MLVQAIPSSFTYIPQIQGDINPKFDGSFEEYTILYCNIENRHMFDNTVKVCTKCGKSNAYTLLFCNGCKESIQYEPIKTSINIFICFSLGIRNAHIPLTISIRYQDVSILVFDDILAQGPIHFNAIPTSVYIPTWKVLLYKPQEGLHLVQTLLYYCNKASEAFWENKDFCASITRKHPNTAVCMDQLKARCYAGFNYPPSQYQLHLQYLSPILNIPLKYSLKYAFTQNRFFSVDYVIKCLEAVVGTTEHHTLLHDSVPIEELILYFNNNYGICYNEYRDAFIENFKHDEELVGWHTSQFKGTIQYEDQMPVYKSDKGDIERVINIDDIVQKDKQILQSYGRPYLNNKPSGSYYSYAKNLSEIKHWI